MSTDPIYGEIRCQATLKSTGAPCKNGAYYKLGTGYYCGVHAKSENRIELEKNTAVLAAIRSDENKKRSDEIEKVAKENKSAGKKGRVMMTKFEMMKPLTYMSGYLAVFPNRDHGGRSDGLGIPELSPMNLGPVNHVMKEYPPALNLENYWQFAKVSANISKSDYVAARTKGYLDPVGQRHGYAGKGAEILFSEFISSKGEIFKYSYMQARFFYCHYYDILAREKIKVLKRMIDDGYNLQIFGFDSFEIGNQSLWEHYNDEKKPFGHEAVIYCLLTIDDPENYPWNLYKDKYPIFYKDMI